MLKKICPKCENVYKRDADNCQNCDGELYYYLLQDTFLNRIKSLFSKNSEEKEILGELQQLEKWEDFFKDYQNNLKKPDEEFFKNINEFKKEKSNFNYLNKLRVEESHYNSLLTDYNAISKFIEELDNDLDKFTNSSLKDFLYQLEENKVSYDDVVVIKSMLNDFNNLDNLKCFEFYNEDSKSIVAIVNEIANLFDDISKEAKNIRNLKSKLDDYDASKTFPKDLENFRRDCAGFRYLDVVPVFYPDLDKYVKIVFEVNGLFEDCGKEIDNFKDVSKEANDVRYLKWKLDNYNDSKIFPKNLEKFRGDCAGFRYLDVVPVFYPDLDKYVKIVFEVNGLFEDCGKEIDNFDDVVKEAKDIRNLKDELDDYDASKTFPKTLEKFRADCAGFNHLDVVPIFYPDLDKYVKIVFDVNRFFDDLGVKIDNFDDVVNEADTLRNLKDELDKYNDSKTFPKDIKKFKDDCSGFKFLNLVSVFYPDLEKYAGIVSEVDRFFKDVEKETRNLESLSSTCSIFSKKFESLSDNFEELDPFLSKYSNLESEINDLEYLDIIGEVDGRFKSSINKINKAKVILNNFDNKIKKIVAKREVLKRNFSFLEDFDDFNKSWVELLSKFRTENDIKIFLKKYSPLKNNIGSLMKVDTKNKDYLNAIGKAQEAVFKLDNIDDFIKINNLNIEFSNFLNTCKTRYVDSNYKREWWYSYSFLFNNLNKLKTISKTLNFDIKNKSSLNSASKDFDKFIKEKNAQFVKNELSRYSSFFSDVDGKSLDGNQRRSIVIDEMNMQVIAGAGCGKTLTISGKVKYLLDKGISPDEILCLSYSKASAEDLVKKLPSDIKASTFHSLGKGILEEDLGNKVSVKDNLLDHVINKFFSERVLENEALLEKVMEFFSYYRYDAIDKENKNLGEILEIEEGRSFITLKEKYGYADEKTTFKYNQRVKSFEELLIANFLFIHDIKYEYEKVYVDKDGNKVKSWSNYKPDFYLTDYGIYLEHFGVNRNFDAPWLDKRASDNYKQGILDKRKLHKRHGTKLIETYSYFVSENILMAELRRLLEENGVEIKEVNYEKVIKSLLKNDKLGSFKSFIDLIKTFISLFKGNNYDFSKFGEFKKRAENEILPFNRKRHLLFLDIVEEIYRRYEKELEDPDIIDFDDMINGAIEVISQNRVSRNYKYIIVDEYQDISYSRFKLLKELQNASDAKLFVVGDDWQSIYRFAGCDVSLFTNFQTYFRNYERCYIKNTYRNSQSLIDIAGTFINRNPNQLTKNLKSKQKSNIANPIKIAFYKKWDNESKIKALERCVNDSARFSNNILILARYNFSIEPYINTPGSPFRFDRKSKDKKTKRIIYEKNPYLNINFLTVHRSKGLEADNVILLDLENAYSGFPSKKDDDSVLQYVINEKEPFEFGEERRLFYVAITRTKKYNYFIVNYDKPSQFVEELREFADFDVVQNIECNPKIDKLIRTDLNCPICKTGKVSILKFNNNFNKFICSHSACPWDGGVYRGKFDDLDILENCSQCDGILHIVWGKNGPFPTCSKWGENSCECGNKLNGKFDDLIEDYNSQIDDDDGFGKILGQCPRCGSNLIKRNGKFGAFVGCAGYPKCNYTCNLWEFEKD